MEKVRCDYCFSEEADALAQETRILHLPEPYKIVRCCSCGLTFMSPRMTAEEYRAFYSSQYYADYDYGAILSEERNPKFERRVRTCNSFKPRRGRLLDIGTATGEFLKAAQDGGWQVWGTEVSAFAAEQAKKNFGLDVFVGEVHDAPYEPGFFDIIHLSHVLEHVPSPRGTLRSIFRLLKDDGMVVIEVPNQFDNWFERIAGMVGRRHMAQEPSMHHVYFYAPRTLRMLLAKEGYTSVIRTYSLNTPYAKKPAWLRPVFSLASRCIDAMGGGLYIEAYGRKILGGKNS